MPAVSWATPEQKTFLSARLDTYRKAQQAGDYTPFWDRLFEEWENTFPTIAELFPGQEFTSLSPNDQTTVGNAVTSKQLQLQSWYRWRCNKRARTAQHRQTKLEKELLTLRTRMPQETEIYSKLCYNKIKPAVRAKIKAEKAITPADKLNIVKTVTREMLENELPEVKEQVENFLSDLKAKRDTVEPKSRTPEDYALAIVECAPLLGRFLAGLTEKTGWAFAVVMGGPDPVAGGEINVASYHTGLNAQGLTFGETYLPFHKTYIEPFKAFLHTVYPPHVRQARRLGEVGGGTFDIDGYRLRELYILDDAHTSGPSSPVRDASLPSLPPSIDAPSAGNAPPLRPCALSDDAPPSGPSSSARDASFRSSSPACDASVHSYDAPPIVPAAGASPVLPDISSAPSPLGAFPDPTFPGPGGPLDGDAMLGFGMFDFRSLDFGITGLNSMSLTNEQCMPNWPTLPGFTGEFNNEVDTSLTSELNDAILPFDPAFFLPPPAPAFGPGASAPSPVTADPSGSLETPVRLDAFPAPTPIPSQATVTADPSGSLETPVRLDAFPAPTPIPSQATGAPTPLATSRHSGRAIVPSTRAQRMNDIGSKSKTITMPETSDANKENHAPGVIPAPPSWLLAAESYLVANDFGSEWTECIKAWRAFEAHFGYTNRKPLSHIGLRPEEWAQWIAKGRNGMRPYDQIPTITSPLEFGTAVMKWWRAIQPAFRQSSDSQMPLPIYDNADDSNCWEPLQRGGPNGMLAVLTLLSWWGQSRKTASQWEEDSNMQWVACVVDFRRVLERIISAKKRGSLHTSAGSASKKVRV